MALSVVGANHRTAPIEVRERFHVDPEDLPGVLDRVRSRAGVRECILLSTCNRSEFYLHVEEPEQAERAARDVLARHAAMDPEVTSDHLYARHGRPSAEHLLEVVAGLDSLVVGEPQIQGQVKEAYDAAREAGGDFVGPILHRLFQTALSAGGEVRARTRIDEGAASVPSAAVQLASKVFGSLEARSAAVVGAGEMGEMTLGAFRDRGVEEVLVASRTVERAEATAARAGARPIPYDSVWERLAELDILVTSTSAPHPVVTVERMEAVSRDRGEPLVVIDIAVPRDVEPSVGDLPGVFLYNIDDLQRVVRATEEARSAEREQAERLLRERAEDFWSWHLAREAVPLIRAVRERAERIRAREMEEALDGLEGLSEEERDELHRASRLALKKILHAPTVGLRRLAAEPEGTDLLEVAHRLFDVDPEELPREARGGEERSGETGDEMKYEG